MSALELISLITQVLMTAARDAAHWAAEMAATAFVSKPFGYDDLIRAVEESRPVS
jgi:hypothetical protein